MSKDGTDYYTISNNYLESLKNTGTDICFLDYDNPVAESKNCHGIVLPGAHSTLVNASKLIRILLKMPIRTYANI